MNIVVIEDYTSLRVILVKTIQKIGHKAIGLSCAEEVDELTISQKADMFIIDLNLPEEDGISLTKRLRKANPLVGIIMLTARDKAEDKVIGYESGADIYLTKPTNFTELSASILALSRRIQAEKMIVTNLKLDSKNLILRCNDLEIGVNETEAIILTRLAQAKNQQLESWQLLEVIDEDMDSEAAKSYLNVRIYRLKQKLTKIGFKNSIRNHREKGYQLCVSLIIT
ncbi:MAG: response regulator transcription factor [Methylococcales bacterium]